MWSVTQNSATLITKADLYQTFLLLSSLIGSCAEHIIIIIIIVLVVVVVVKARDSIRVGAAVHGDVCTADSVKNILTF